MSSLEPPFFVSEFSWQNVRSALEDYFYRLQQLLLQRPFGDGVQDLTGAGAISLSELTTKWTTTGANAGVLADGFEGQMKYIVMVVDAGDGTLTPDNLKTYNTITFNDVGDVCQLQFLNAKWWVIYNSGCVLA